MCRSIQNNNIWLTKLIEKQEELFTEFKIISVVTVKTEKPKINYVAFIIYRVIFLIGSFIGILTFSKLKFLLGQYLEF